MKITDKKVWIPALAVLAALTIAIVAIVINLGRYKPIETIVSEATLSEEVTSMEENTEVTTPVEESSEQESSIAPSSAAAVSSKTPSSSKAQSIASSKTAPPASSQAPPASSPTSSSAPPTSGFASDKDAFDWLLKQPGAAGCTVTIRDAHQIKLEKNGHSLHIYNGKDNNSFTYNFKGTFSDSSYTNIRELAGFLPYL